MRDLNGNPRGVVSDCDMPVGVHYVDSPEALASLVERIRRAQSRPEVFRCCLDTEADSLHHFQEKPALSN